MKNNEILTNTVIEIFKDAVLNQHRVMVCSTNHIFNSYDDASGQRDAYLSFWGYTNQGINLDKPHCSEPNSFFVRRKLSFCNTGDEGKEDAILLVIHGNNIKNAKEIIISSDSVIIDNIEISIYKK